eukprot:TRINITY_DN18668_c0_g1_i1.p1 TRINITY_DN18668_c0_g1~~TRINITY_DN18668_c0_g1_i1.p1  ORF type:complete len:753 (+),score=67.13 TRINITY_DN18668_c0_g1_i1:148-2406(+)
MELPGNYVRDVGVAAESARVPALVNTNVEIAALFVHKALDAVPVNSAFLLCAVPNERRLNKALLAHRLRARWKYVRWGIIVFTVLLTLWEEPRWCGSVKELHCYDPHYFMFGLTFVSFRLSLLLEGLAVCFLLVDLVCWCVVIGASAFVAWRWRIFHAFVLLALVVDVLCATFRLPDYSWRLAPYCRSILLVAYDSSLQQEMNSLFRSVKELLKVFFMLALFVVVYAWVGAVLFTINGPEGEYFTDFGTSLWTLLVLLTTNNFPDVIIPGYTRSRLYAIYFILYLVIALFLLLQLVIAVVYNGYTRQFEAVCKDHVVIRQGLFDAAFGLLDVDCRGWLGRHQLDVFFGALNRCGGFRIGDEARRSLTFAVLDSNGTGRIDRHEFRSLSRVLYLRFEPLHQPWLHAHFPNLWERCSLDRVREGIVSRHFSLAVDFVLLCSVALTVAETWPSLVGEQSQRATVFSWSNALDILFTMIFLNEMLLKITLLGWAPYWSSAENRFDALATVSAVGAVIYVILPNGFDDFFLVKIPVICRFFRLLRLLTDVPAFRTIFAALAAVKPGARRIFPLLLCTALFFNALGCDLFGGLITTDPRSPSMLKLRGTTYATAGYYSLNFNDASGGLVTLFGGLVMNNWDTYVDGFAAVAGVTARIYFFAWYIFGVLVGLNLVTSVVLDAFVERWGSLHSRDQQGTRSRQSVINAEMVTGTPTGLSGPWAVTNRRFSLNTGLDQMLNPTSPNEASPGSSSSESSEEG